MSYRVAFVGTGDPDNEGGYAMAYRHARGYDRLEECDLVACADIVKENAIAFAREFAIDTDEVYEEYERMLTQADPDIVSVCVPPDAHAEIVVGCARGDTVDAIHCEKPMAATWKQCREMVDACNKEDVQLTINHQRRFAAPFKKAKTALDSGRIGTLQRIELGGPNLYDYGTHLFDMCSYLTDHVTAEWVLGQVDYHTENRLFGMHNENQALARWRYSTGVDGIASTGDEGLISCQLRLIGDAGTIEIGPENGPPLRIRSGNADWDRIDTGNDGIYRVQTSRVSAAGDAVMKRLPLAPDRVFRDPTYIDRAIKNVVQALKAGREPELAASKALIGTELIFACWESARRGGRVKLPLKIDDNPLEAMVASGELSPSAPASPEED